MSYKRLPNGIGTVTKEKGNRRKPWRAMVPIGRKTSASGSTYTVYKRIGSYATRTEAVKALMTRSTEAGLEKATLNDVYEKWKEARKTPLPPSKVSAYKHLRPLWHKQIASLKTLDLEKAINNPAIPRTMRAECVIILHGVFDYALRHELVEKDYSKLAQYDLDAKTRIVRKVFTHEEVEALWERSDGFYERCLLILLYTGLRVSELGAIRPEDVHLDDEYMVGGLKTDAGRNRIIPIHPKIKPLIKEEMEKHGDYVLQTPRGTQLLEHNLRQFLLKNDIPHTPHDTRHTYATQAYKCGMDENITKRIIGHKLDGLTQQVYIHMTPQDLVNENKKYYL